VTRDDDPDGEPALRAARAAALARLPPALAKRGRRPATAEPPPTTAALSRLWMVREEMATIYRLARAERLDLDTAERLVAMLDRVGRMLERERHERDLDAGERLEEALVDLERVKTILATGQYTPEQMDALRAYANSTTR
jgi:hypothetical protein